MTRYCVQGVVPPEEPPQDLSDGGLPHEQSRPESPEDQAVQDLCDSLSQGSESLPVAHRRGEQCSSLITWSPPLSSLSRVAPLNSTPLSSQPFPCRLVLLYSSRNCILGFDSFWRFLPVVGQYSNIQIFKYSNIQIFSLI